MKGFLLLISVLLVCTSTGATLSEETDNIYSLFEEAKGLGADKIAPLIFKEARSFYEQAVRELGNGNDEKAGELREISQIKIKTAISLARKKTYEDGSEKLQREIEGANSERQTHEEELRKNVLKLQAIKDRVAVSEEKLRSIAFDELEKSAKKIRNANEVSAETFSPDVFNEANIMHKKAEENLALGEYETSIKLAEEGLTLAETAYEASKKRFELRERIIDRLSHIYGVKAESVGEGLKVTLRGIFAPSGTSMLFDAYPSIDQAAHILTEHPNLSIRIEAYPGDSESEEDNLELSQSQSEVVKNYLILKGISSERFKNADNTGSGRSEADTKLEDRRIELFINFVESDNV